MCFFIGKNVLGPGPGEKSNKSWGNFVKRVLIRGKFGFFARPGGGGSKNRNGNSILARIRISPLNPSMNWRTFWIFRKKIADEKKRRRQLVAAISGAAGCYWKVCEFLVNFSRNFDHFARFLETFRIPPQWIRTFFFAKFHLNEFARLRNFTFMNSYVCEIPPQWNKSVRNSTSVKS